MRIAPPVVLDASQQETLKQWAGSRSLPARQIERAKVVLLAAAGQTDLGIAAALRITNQKAARWRQRFLSLGLDGLIKDAPRPGRKPAIAARLKAEVVRKTTRSKPSNATHWSTRTMAAEMGISEATVRRIWHAHGLKPHLLESFKISKDKRFAEKLEDIVGLYLNPPERAIVMCVDEKSQIQALDRTQPGLPLKKGRCGTMTHDYVHPWSVAEVVMGCPLHQLPGKAASVFGGRLRSTYPSRAVFRQDISKGIEHFRYALSRRTEKRMPIAAKLWIRSIIRVEESARHHSRHSRRK